MARVDDLTAFVRARLDEDERELVKDPPHGLGYANLAARVRREVAAKRAIIAIHVPDEDRDCLVCITERAGYQEQWAWDPWPCQTIRHLAAAWSDHPDYRPQWVP